MKLNKNLDLNKLAVFCQVIDSGNYQRASEVLHVTPSALSQTVTGLEGALGFALFERRGRRLIPTANGLRLHREFRSRQRDLVRVIDQMGAAAQQVSGLVRIGAYLEFAKARLSGVMKDFIQEFPQAHIKTVFDSPSRLQELLLHGQLDICFSIFPAAENKALQSTALAEEELVLISSAGLLPETPSFDQVMSVPVIDYYFNHQPIRRWLALHYGKRPKKIPVRIFASTAEMVLALVREGAGVGVVPRYLVQSQKDARIIRPTARQLNDFIWLLERAGGERSPIAAMFRTRVLARFAGDG